MLEGGAHSHSAGSTADPSPSFPSYPALPNQPHVQECNMATINHPFASCTTLENTPTSMALAPPLPHSSPHSPPQPQNSPQWLPRTTKAFAPPELALHPTCTTSFPTSPSHKVVAPIVSSSLALASLAFTSAFEATSSLTTSRCPL